MGSIFYFSVSFSPPFAATIPFAVTAIFQAAPPPAARIAPPSHNQAFSAQSLAPTAQVFPPFSQKHFSLSGYEPVRIEHRIAFVNFEQQIIRLYSDAHLTVVTQIQE